jgi:uncharacterized protein (TIGR03086 family)
VNPIELHRRVTDSISANIDAIGDSEWGNPTPCSEWDLRGLVGHLVSESLWMEPLLAGRTIADVGDALEGDLLGDDPKAAWHRAVEVAQTALSAPGAREVTAHLSYGDFSGHEYSMQVVCDLIVHGWDLAVSVGAPDDIDPDLLAIADAEMRPVAEMLTASGHYGEVVELPADADAQTRFLAMIGRRRHAPLASVTSDHGPE